MHFYPKNVQKLNVFYSYASHHLSSAKSKPYNFTSLSFILYAAFDKGYTP